MADLTLPRRSLLAFTASFATVTLTTGAHAAAPVRGGKLVYARYADSVQLDPVRTSENTDIWVMNSIYETLLLPTTDGLGIRPGLATKWELSDGGKTLTLTLREGVKFSNAMPMEASDVKWSLDRCNDPKGSTWAEMTASIDSVEIVSPTSIVLKLKHPDPTILPALAMFCTAVLPEKVFAAAKGGTPEEKAASVAEKPIGTGPFMITEWKRGEIMRLARNPYYWQNAPDGKPLPYVDTLELPVIQDDATRILKLQSGEVHGAEFIPYSRVKEMQDDPRLRAELWPSTGVTYLVMNVRPQVFGKPNPLADLRVRQALNYAVNKELVIAITTHGLGKPMSSFMSSVTPLHYGSGPVFPFDPAKAKQLLADAGFASGLELNCQMLAGSVDEKNNMTTIQQMLTQVGVKVTLEQMDYATRVAHYVKGDFQMRSNNWTDDIADPSEMTSRVAYSPTIDCSHTGYKNDRVDALFKLSQEEIDPAKRKAEYVELQQIYNAQGPLMPLYESPYAVAFRKNAVGFVQIPLGNNYFDGCYIAA